jgi:lipoic acid synthetase
MALELFDTKPKVKVKGNPLPENPDTGTGRFPKWLHRPLPDGPKFWETKRVIQEHGLHTVCEEAKCPNRLECYSKKTATFLTLGKDCTRNCGFCDVDFSKKPSALDPNEPLQVAESVQKLGLKHVVLTMVARDDLEDGGAGQLASIMQAIRLHNPEVTIEVLTSDFEGRHASIQTVLEAKPDIFNHNIETVEAKTKSVRHKATYERSLEVLRFAKSFSSSLYVKSGIMLGLGETEDEVKATLHDLKNIPIDMVTMGQYLQPNRKKLRVQQFVTPEMFKAYEDYGHRIGIPYMHCGPFIRSSYNADKVLHDIQTKLKR